MGEVKPFPLSAEKALEIIHDAVKDSSRVGIPDDLGFSRPEQDWQHVVTHRQIIRCLENGDIEGEPEIDEHGNTKCTLKRFGAGELVTITVVAVHDNEKKWNLFVTDWSKSDGPK